MAEISPEARALCEWYVEGTYHSDEPCGGCEKVQAALDKARAEERKRCARIVREMSLPDVYSEALREVPPEAETIAREIETEP